MLNFSCHSKYQGRIMELKNHKKEILLLSVFIVFFAAVSVFSQHYSYSVKNSFPFHSLWSVFFYIFAVILSEVISPISALPLLPIAVTLWGSFVTALLSLAGWIIGALIAFSLSRRYGRSFVDRLPGFSKIEETRVAIPAKNLFWSILLLRMIFPVDFFSYAIGLFTNMSLPSYILASFIGLTPFAFILSYGVTLPVVFQIAIATIIVIITIFGYRHARQKMFSMASNN